MVRQRVTTLAMALVLAVGGVLFLGGAAHAAVTAAVAQADPPAPPGTPTASTSAPTATVGPIFRDGITADHECTASVVASPSRDLILTAAHCVTGTGAGYLFVPGYSDGATPYGVWTVTHTYLDPSWVQSQDTQHDYAILQVARLGGAKLQDVTGANLLAVAPRAGSPITDIAYNAGIDDDPIACTTSTYRTDGYPTFDCHGYVGGSSGSPWLSSVPGSGITLVRGVIGGLHQGGCYEYTSYSSRFDGDAIRLLVRATLRVHPDVAPAAGSDGC